MRCPRPGCDGEIVDGNCRVCGIAVPEQPAVRAEDLRRQAAEAAERLSQKPATDEEEGTGWFRSPDVLTGSDQPPPPGRGAHRRPDDASPQPVAPQQQPTPTPPRGQPPGLFPPSPGSQPAGYRPDGRQPAAPPGPPTPPPCQPPQ